MEEAEEAIYPDFMTKGQDTYYSQMAKLIGTIGDYRIAYVTAGTADVLAGAEAAPIAWDGTRRRSAERLRRWPPESRRRGRGPSRKEMRSARSI